MVVSAKYKENKQEKKGREKEEIDKEGEKKIITVGRWGETVNGKVLSRSERHVKRSILGKLFMFLSVCVPIEPINPST